MKIIDLLNKIANDEEVPEKIKFENNIYNAYYYENKVIDYYYTDELKNQRTLFDDSMYDYGITSYLNDEVEIIEENKEKKIPEKIDNATIDGMKCAASFETLKPYIALLMRTQNEIIDYLKSKGDE